MDISVVVPVHNEAENIEPLIQEIREALDGQLDYEVLYVDDGSSDATPDILKQLQNGFPRLRVLRHLQCCGQSSAIHSGVQAARAEWIVTLDGDGQNDPADIPKLLAVIRDPDRPANLHMVGGQRKKRRDTWIKRMSSKIANGVRSRLLKDSTPDTGCGLKVFNREVFLQLPFFDHMHRFLAALFQRQGSQVMSVEVHHRPRERGISKYGLHNRLWVGIVDLFGVMWLQRRSKQPQVTEIK
jgi:dolichol-phosphate mannosyltransferase